MNKQNGFAGILVLVVVAIAAVAGGMYYFGIQKGGSSSSFSPSPYVAVDETANWKTYTNTKYGYRLRYPPDWVLSSGVGLPHGDDARLETTSVLSLDYLNEKEDRPRIWVSVSEFYLTLEQQYEDLLDGRIGDESEKSMEYAPVYSSEKIKINGLEAIKSVVQDPEFKNGRSLTVVIIKDGYEYGLTLSYLEPPTQEVHMFNQILSTFRFN